MDLTGDVGYGGSTVASLVLSQAFVNWHKAFMRVLDPHKLTYSQWIIMHTLMATGEAMSPSELNRYLTIEGTSISVVIDGIERRGIIQRRRSRADRRVVKVRLTAEGRKLLNIIDVKIDKLIKEIFGTLTASERRQLIALCRKVRDASITHNGGDIGEVEHILMRFSGGR